MRTTKAQISASAQSDQHLRCLDSIIPPVSISKISRVEAWISSTSSFCGCAGQFVSYLVANPEDRFSRVAFSLWEYHTNPINLDKKNCCNYSENWTMWFHHRIMYPKYADGMANSVYPAVCPDLSAWYMMNLNATVAARQDSMTDVELEGQ